MDNVGYNHKGQYPHQHESHGDGDDGSHHGVVASVRADQPAQATSDPVGRPAHVHHRGGGDSLLQLTQVEASVCRGLGLLALLGQGEHGGFAVTAGRWVLQKQLSFTALEADGQRSLHVRGQFADDVLVVAQPGQVLAVGQLGQLAAHRAAEGLELRGGDVDASQTLQAEGVTTGQQLGGLKDVVVGAETHGALCVVHIILRGSGPPAVAVPFSPVSSAGLLAPATLPPLPMVRVPLSPPASVHPLRVAAPRPPHFGRLLPPAVLRLAVLFLRAGFGFDVGSLGVSTALAPVSLPIIVHAGGMMLEVERWLESEGTVFQQKLWSRNTGISSMASRKQQSRKHSHDDVAVTPNLSLSTVPIVLICYRNKIFLLEC